MSKLAKRNRQSSIKSKAGHSLKKRKTDGTDCEALLSINDLADILDLLQRHGYSGTNYYKFGLYLGLLPGTLDVIKEDNKGDVSSGLRECLKAWLEQAENVKEKGIPSYYSLIQALRKLGENAVANGIDREKHSACVIFTQYESNDCIVDVLPQLAILLFKESVIEEMLIPATGEGSVLLKAVKRSICFDYHNLKKFATVIMRLNAQSVTSVAHSLLKDYRKAFPDDYVTIVSKENISISLPLKLTPEFTKIRTMFTDLIDDVAQAMDNSVKYENLKRYIGRNETLRPHLAHCQNTDDIIELIGDECSLINVALLEGVVKKYKVKEAESAIQKYKNEIETFHEKGRPIRQFLDQYLAPASPLQCETATILVRKEVKDCEVKDINILMIVAFETLAPNVRVHVIKEGNSFTITCSFPVLLSESLIATALDNIDSLIERGVKKLTIGYSTVYDHELFQDDKTATSKKYILTSEMKQQLSALVYSSQGTKEQLLISRTIQLLNSEEELASVQQLKEKNEKLEAEVKVLSGMKLEASSLIKKESLLQKTLETPPPSAPVPSQSGQPQVPLSIAEEPQPLSLTTQPPPTAPKPHQLSITAQPQPTALGYHRQPLSAASVLLIGSTGMGKSTLGNYLLDPDEKHIVDNPTFAPSQDNRPMTQEVQVVSKKVQIDDHKSEELTIIDAPGLNESAEKDLSHMIDIIKKLNDCGEISACILVVKFNAKIDAQYKTTMKYYNRLLPGFFERNVIIVMTDYASDDRSEKLRKRQGIKVDEVKQNKIFAIGQCSNNQIQYTPQLFTIDCLPMPDDNDEMETSEKIRRAILDYILQLPPIKVKNQMVAKTDYIKQKDHGKYQRLLREIAGYNERLKEDHKDSAMALDDTFRKKKEIDGLENEISNLQKALLDKNTTEVVVAGHVSIEEEWKAFQWFTQEFNIISPHEITHYKTWSNEKCEFKDVVQTSHAVKGRVIGQFIRGIYASVTAYTQKKIKYAKEIKDLNDKIREKNINLKQCKEALKEFQKIHTEKKEEIKLLLKYINERKAAAKKICSDLMTMKEAISQLEEMNTSDSE